ncbi:MAG TPA: hypothetical protein VFA33_07635 [Bryobacteraceae bacterium]|nr:hypothetical protein [Bryobacteraceae bacterium]
MSSMWSATSDLEYYEPNQTPEIEPIEDEPEECPAPAADYYALLKALQIISAAKLAVGREDGPQVCSPAWRLLAHTADYLDRAATLALRGGEA